MVQRRVLFGHVGRFNAVYLTATQRHACNAIVLDRACRRTDDDGFGLISSLEDLSFSAGGHSEDSRARIRAVRTVGSRCNRPVNIDIVRFVCLILCVLPATNFRASREERLEESGPVLLSYIDRCDGWSSRPSRQAFYRAYHQRERFLN